MLKLVNVNTDFSAYGKFL